MNTSTYGSIFFLLGLTVINIHYATVQEKDNVFPAGGRTHQLFFDDIIKDLNSISCSGDSALEHLSQIVQFFAVHKKDYAHLKTIFRLFSNRYKGVDYINAKRLTVFLQELYINLPKGDHLSYNIGLLHDPTSFDQFTKEIKTCLIKDFSEQFNDFKKDPESFITNLAKKITKQVEQEAEFLSMQQTIARFLEITIGKLIWSPYDQEKTWENVQHICKQLVLLLEKNIITDVDSLDDLLWSLVHRYAYFIDLTGSLLSPAFYEKVLYDLKNDKLIMSIVEEQDELLKPKALFLKEKIITAQTKALLGADKKL